MKVGKGSTLVSAIQGVDHVVTDNPTVDLDKNRKLSSVCLQQEYYWFDQTNCLLIATEWVTISLFPSGACDVPVGA